MNHKIPSSTDLASKAGEEHSPGERLSSQATMPEDVARLRQLLLANPNNAELCHNLALTLGRHGLREEAIGSLQRAIEIDPQRLQARLDLAFLHSDSGDIVNAVRGLIETARLFPQSAQPHQMVGNILRDTGKFDEAIKRYKVALRLQPDGSIYFSLGIALSQSQQVDEAADAYRNAIALDPSISGAYNNLGTILLDRKDNIPEAIACFQRAIRLQPDIDAYHRNLGIALWRKGRHDDAIHAFRAALRLKADSPESLIGLGKSLRDSGRPAEAIVPFHEGLRLRPEWPESYNELAIALVFLNRLDEAIVHFNRTLQLKPDHPTALRNRGMALLTKGDLEQGWVDHEQRGGAQQPPGRVLSQPLWDGTPLNGRTILIYHEQGFGDTIQFIRFVRYVKETGGRVIFECPRRMMKLLRNCHGIDQFVSQQEPLPPFDVYASVMSLPFLLWRSVKTIPTDIPYLFPDMTLVQLWAYALRHISGFKIAFVWQGNPRFQGDRHRSFPLHHFGALARIPGVRLISVQQDKGAEQLARAHFPALDLGGGTFSETTAILKNVDLVITPDTSVAHLAGAIGTPVWVLLRYAADWRWMLGREDSPWYPTMRLFRQPEPNNWSAVFKDVAQKLSEIVARPQRPGSETVLEIVRAASSNRQSYLGKILRVVGKRLMKQRPLDDAVKCFLDAVKIEPDQAEDHATLGLVYLQMKDPVAAINHLERSLALRPNQPDVHCNLGVAAFRLDCIREAALHYRQALRLQPNHVDALHNMGNLQLVTGHLDPAIATLQAAVRYRPDAAPSHILLGKAFARKGDSNHAIAAFRRATELNPKLAEAYFGLGKALADVKQKAEAVTVLQRAIRLAPLDGEAHFQLGNSLRALGRAEEAISSYHAAIDLLPTKAAVWNNLGATLLDLDRFEEAETAYRNALAEQRNYPEIWTGLGNVLRNQSRFEEAHTCYAESLRVDPNNVEAHISRGLTSLLQGDMRQGWRDYEWRLHRADQPRLSFSQPRWDGSPLTGRTILLIPEQGLGDTIQFIRYIPLLKAQGARVILLAPPSMRTLLKTVDGIDHLAEVNQPIPPFDVYAHLVSLPAQLGTIVESIAAPIPYLSADPGLVEHWSEVIESAGGALKVGIVWQGNPDHGNDRRRSMPLRYFEPLARLEGVRLFSLQVGPGHEQLTLLRDSLPVTDLGIMFDPGSVGDVTAVISQMHLIVSVDTMVVHLAGALGIPVWILLPRVPDWRWLLDCEDSPWYPTAWLFRQTLRGEWSDVFERIAQGIRDLRAKGNGCP